MPNDHYDPAILEETSWDCIFNLQDSDGWLRDPVQWRSAPEQLPDDWVEAKRAEGPDFEARREDALCFASQRRRESESQAVLALEDLPAPPPAPIGPARVARPLQFLHPDTPNGTLWQPRLFVDAIESFDVKGDITWRSPKLDEVNDWLLRAANAVKALEVLDDATSKIEAVRRRAEAAPPSQRPMWKARIDSQLAELRRLPKPDPPEDVLEVGQEWLNPWAQDRIWKSDELGRCTLEQPSTPEDPPKCEIKRGFFREWAHKLGWPDKEMLYGIEAGVDSHADCDLTTVLRFHHKGLRRNFGPARESIEADTSPEREWISKGTPFLQYWPSRLVARNVAEQTKWKRGADGKVFRVVKYRVTTDDSAEDIANARNSAMPRDEWEGPYLGNIGRLARAVAILKTWMPEEVAISTAQSLLESGMSEEHIVLWAIDLSDAYRKLAVQRMELWLQGFVWSDGCRIDRRAVFGTASMVQFFSRISLFLQAVTRVRINEWSATQPWSNARRAWIERKQSATFYIDMYIDVSRHANTRTSATSKSPYHRKTRQSPTATMLVFDARTRRTPARG